MDIRHHSSLKSQDHHLSLTIKDGLSTLTFPGKMIKMNMMNKKIHQIFWLVASSQVKNNMFILNVNEPSSFGNHHPRFPGDLLVCCILDLADVTTESNLCLLLGSFSQCFIALSLKGFNVILAQTSKDHGTTSK